MKYVKTMLVLTMAFAGTQTFAQQKQEKQWDPEQMAQKHTERLTERLDLSEEQAAKVKAIQLDAIADRQEARENGEWTKENRRAYMQQQRSEKEAELKEVLTDEQEQKWEELKKEFHGKHRKGHKGRRDSKEFNPEASAAKQTERMTENLHLSAEQAAQVKEIFLARAEARKEFRSEENKSREARKAARMQQHKQQEAALKEVLTEAQWTQWEQLKEERKAQHQEHRGNKGYGKHGKGSGGKKSPQKQ